MSGNGNDKNGGLTPLDLQDGGKIAHTVIEAAKANEPLITVADHESSVRWIDGEKVF